MRVEYWDPSEFDCDPEVCDPRTIHLHVNSEAGVIEAYFRHVDIYRRRLEHPGESLVGPPVGQRYCCIRGPRGLLRSIS